MSFRKALLAATVIAVPASAMAQTSPAPVTGLYIAGGAGVNWLMDRDIEARGGNRTYFTDRNTNAYGETRQDTGWGGAVALGWGFGNGVRAEVEGNYRQNEVDKIGGFGGPTTSRAFRNNGGDIRQYGVMANAYYDFNIPNFPVVPYIGAGAGYIWTEYDGVRGTRQAAGSNSVVIDGTDGSFAWQGIAGAAYPIRSVPGLALTLEYRYMGTLEPNLNGRVVNPQGQTVSSGKYRADNAENHSIFLGVRYAFNQPRPAPVAAFAPAPAAQAPAPARTYLVFFDFDRADLTDRARQIIADAAQAVQSTGTTRIEVAGHADRSGTPQYNQRLSMRRAEAVAAELSRRGITRDQMSIQAFGESRPLVPTADGVREPQNRRVEIVLR
ncbi:OmpA family protein [Roseomonas sp. SSH11]|uniref:OmpA family protein n=1 Tax=Pararoseomonas baculiformis TaxID=2820812 RepID=A0ABS4AAD3_9PROT|nr:OmpA family protein [Pararoseomonas baculiformis]MBP0443953.1 OmpA family protein [Pararoseomonas baculiformis]